MPANVRVERDTELISLSARYLYDVRPVPVMQFVAVLYCRVPFADSPLPEYGNARSTFTAPSGNTCEQNSNVPDSDPENVLSSV